MEKQEPEYSFDFVTKEGLNPFVFCKTCGEVLKDPVCTCKHLDVHCRECVSDVTSCPTCGGEPHLKEALFVVEALEVLEVFCCNKNLGCEWKGARGSALNHVQNGCSSFVCAGKHSGCNWKGKKKEISKHEEECDFITISCPNGCSCKFFRKELKSHESICEILSEKKKLEEKRIFEEKKKKYQEQLQKIEEERKSAQDNINMKFSQKVIPKHEDIISLNVRGKTINVSKSKLLSDRSSPFFKEILNIESNWKNNQMMLDRDPKLFSFLLRYIDYECLYTNIPSTNESLILIESIFWCIKGLAEEMMNNLYTNFKNCSIHSLDVSGYDFSNWTFKNVTFINCDFSNCNFESSQFYQSNFEGCTFKGSCMKNTNLQNCNISNHDLSFVDLFGINISNCILKGTLLTPSLMDCKFIGTGIGDLQLKDYDLSYTNLSKAILTNVDLSSCNLENVILPENFKKQSPIEKSNESNELKDKKVESKTEVIAIAKEESVVKTDIKADDIAKNKSIPPSKTTELYDIRKLPRDISNYKLIDCNLSHKDFRNYLLTNGKRGIDLSGSIFSKNTKFPEDLRFCNFSRCDLSQIDLSRHNLTGCIFNKTILPKDLHLTNLTGCNLSDMDLSESQLSSIQLFSGHGSGCNLSRCNLTNTKLPKNLSTCNFSKCDLSNRDLSSYSLSNGFNRFGANLSECKLDNTILPKDISHCNLSKCNLSNLDLSSTILFETNLSGCLLTDTKLPTNLSSCNLSNCNLSGRDLSNSILYSTRPVLFADQTMYGTNLQCCILINTKLPKDLRKCDLSGCDLSNRDFSSFNLQNTNLTNCILTNTKLPPTDNTQ